MYCLTVMLFIPRRTTSKNIDEMYSKTWNVWKKCLKWNSAGIQFVWKWNSKIDTQCILMRALVKCNKLFVQGGTSTTLWLIFIQNIVNWNSICVKYNCRLDTLCLLVVRGSGEAQETFRSRRRGYNPLATFHPKNDLYWPAHDTS